jgi:hypothetical protein
VEEAQFDDLLVARVQPAQLGERLVQRADVHVSQWLGLGPLVDDAAGDWRTECQETARCLVHRVQPVFLPTSPALGIDVGDAYWLSLGF